MESREVYASRETEFQRSRSTLAGIEGPGASGKGRTIEAVSRYLLRLARDFPNQMNIRTITEPPDWEIDGFVPYTYLTAGRFDQRTALAANALWRGMRYRGAYLDGKELEPSFQNFLQDPFGVALLDRTFISSIVYQEVFPGGELQGNEELFAALHEGIPFPDLLFIIVTNPETLIARLSARSDGDVFDKPEIQGRIYAGYQHVIDKIRTIPGVYVVESKGPSYVDITDIMGERALYSSSFLIALRVLIANIEKSGQTPIFFWDKEHPESESGILRVPSLPGLSVYILRGFVKGFRHLVQKELEGTRSLLNLGLDEIEAIYSHTHVLDRILPAINGDLALGRVGTCDLFLMAVESWEQLAENYPYIRRGNLFKTDTGVAHLLNLIIRSLNEVRGRYIDLGYGGGIYIPENYPRGSVHLGPDTHCGTAVCNAKAPVTVGEVVRGYFLN